jgi:hypothetical protein
MIGNRFDFGKFDEITIAVQELVVSFTELPTFARLASVIHGMEGEGHEERVTPKNRSGR